MSILYKLFDMLLKVLPDSPVQGWVESFKSVSFLGYLNYFLPISFMVDVTTIWVSMIVTYRLTVFVYGFIKRLFIK